MEQKTTYSKAGLIETMVILKVCYRNNYFHIAEPNPYLVTSKDLTIHTYFSGFLLLFTTLASKTSNTEILIRD